MKDEFFNYKKYVFDSGEESSKKEDLAPIIEQDFSSFVLFSSDDLDSDKKSKLSQILTAIKMQVEDCTMISGSTRSEYLTNALDNQKVMDLMCFGRPKELPDVPINTATELKGKTIFITHTLKELIEEEQKGEVSKRKSLWRGLKSWRLK